MKLPDLFIALLLFSAHGWAQALTDEAPAAPVPLQITSGKKMFISNAQGESAAVTAFPNETYNEFYAAMKDWGRYELVATPADADLICEIRFMVAIGPTTIYRGGETSPQEPQIRLVIFDPKTHVVVVGVHRAGQTSGAQRQRKEEFQADSGQGGE